LCYIITQAEALELTIFVLPLMFNMEIHSLFTLASLMGQSILIRISKSVPFSASINILEGF